MDQKKRDRHFRRLAERRATRVQGGAPEEDSMMPFFILAQQLLMTVARAQTPTMDGDLKVISFGSSGLGLPPGLLLADASAPGRCVLCLYGDDVDWVFFVARYSGSFSELVGNIDLIQELVAQEPQPHAMVESAFQELYALGN